MQSVERDFDGTEEMHEFINSQLEEVQGQIENLGMEYYIDTPEEQGDALVYLTAGAGGDDSNDWTAMLMRMYQKWGEHHNFDVNEVEVAEAEFGIRNACIQICGEMVYGWLRNETGVHRLVRISPFNAQGKRQTSFASVTVVPSVNEDINVEIRPSDLRIETMRASGPGGQHVNTTDSAVRITHIPTGITASSSNKSQMLNKKLAMVVLKSRLYERESQSRGRGSADLKSKIDQQSWGAQIRNYVLHPYQNVVDTRTRMSCPQPNAVLDGTKLDDFLLASLHWQGNNTKEM